MSGAAEAVEAGISRGEAPGTSRVEALRFALPFGSFSATAHTSLARGGLPVLPHPILVGGRGRAHGGVAPIFRVPAHEAAWVRGTEMRVPECW
ncbi:hypothetical protein GCM10010392_20620 [Streptomyces clavifer]|nr:hypothetical protein GCM10010392_20620 [Streptomyces clavifer]